jgi:hypothetical protein
MRVEQAGQAGGWSWCPGLQILLPEQTGGPRQAIYFSEQLLLLKTFCSNVKTSKKLITRPLSKVSRHRVAMANFWHTFIPS